MTRRAPPDWRRPGHIFPLRARPVGARAGRPDEASVDLRGMAGLTPAGVNLRNHERGRTMARVPQLAEFATARAEAA